MAEEQNAGAPAGTERPIQFQGREIWVKFPSGEALTVWRLSLQSLQRDDAAGWDGQKAINAYDRLRRIIDSVIINRVDKDWLDIEWLEGRLDLVESSKIIQLTIEAFSDDNRATKRAAAKKVTRRKVSK